jgi:hypothetical protein
VTSKPSLGTITVVEKALPDIFWQPAQWHAIVTIGGLVMAKRTLPQRQPPSIGRDQSGMPTLLVRDRRSIMPRGERRLNTGRRQRVSVFPSLP